MNHNQKNMKKYYFVSFLVIVKFIFAQDLASAEYVATGSFGAATINGKIYNQISFRPEIRISRLGVGLDLNIYLDENGKIYE